MEKRTDPTSVAPVPPAGAAPRAAAPAPLPRPSSGADTAPATPRAPYAPPVLGRLGAWRALTLQQSVQIFP